EGQIAARAPSAEGSSSGAVESPQPLSRNEKLCSVKRPPAAAHPSRSCGPPGATTRQRLESSAAEFRPGLREGWPSNPLRADQAFSPTTRGRRPKRLPGPQQAARHSHRLTWPSSNRSHEVSEGKNGRNLRTDSQESNQHASQPG